VSKSLQDYLAEDVPSQSGAVPLDGLVPVIVDDVLYVATPEEIESGIATGPTGPAGPDAWVFEYPPAFASRGAGQLWLIPSLGHSAIWSGTAWVAQTPSDAELNLCCIIDAFSTWYDSEQYDGSTPWENLGSGGSSYNGAVSGSVTGTDGDGRQYVDFDGTDDYVEFPDGAAWTYTTSDDATLVAVVHMQTVTTQRQFYGNRATTASSATTAGFGIITNGSSLWSARFSDGAAGTTVNTGVTAENTTIHMLVAERDTTTDEIRLAMDGGTEATGADATTATADTSNPQRAGRMSTGTVYTDMRGYVFGMARRILTADEKLIVADWYEARFA
jgi:hypothetical protein